MCLYIPADVHKKTYTHIYIYTYVDIYVQFTLPQPRLASTSLRFDSPGIWPGAKDGANGFEE